MNNHGLYMTSEKLVIFLTFKINAYRHPNLSSEQLEIIMIQHGTVEMNCHTELWAESVWGKI